MKITDDMLHRIDGALTYLGSCGGFDVEIEYLRDALEAARRATPDREAIIEECAKVCEAWSESIDTGNKRNRVVAAAMQGALSCAFEIRALKTAPTSEERSPIKLAHYDAFDDAEKAVSKEVEVLKKILKGD